MYNYNHLHLSDMGKRAILSAGEKKKDMYVPTRHNTLVQTILPMYGVNSSISKCCAGDILNVGGWMFKLLCEQLSVFS
jgi:hypothetical protein